MELLDKLFPKFKTWYQKLRNMVRSITWKDTLWVLSGNVFNKVLGLVSFTILTRSLGPEMYGVYSIAISVLMLAGDLSDLGINSALIRYGAEYSYQKDDERLRTLFSISIRSRILLGTVIFIVGITLAHYLANSVYQNNLLYPFLMVAFGGVFIILLNSTMSSVLTATQQFKRLFIINLCYGICNVVGIVILVFSGSLNAMSAFIVSIIAPLIASIAAIRMLPNKFINLALKNKEISRKIFHFGKWMFVWSLAFIVYNQINIVMLSNLGNATMVGYYNTAFRIAALTQILTGAYSTVLNPKLSTLINNRPEMIKEFRHAFIYCGLLICALVIGIFVAPAIITILAGAKYISSIPVMQVLLGWMILATTNLPFSSFIYAQGKTHFFAFSIILECIFMALLNLWLIPLYGAWGAALSLTISQIPTNLIIMVPVVLNLRKKTIPEISPTLQ